MTAPYLEIATIGGGIAAGMARVYNSINLSISNNTNTVLTYNTERFDSGSVAFQSASNLTGTVAKTATSTTLTGTTTVFTTELTVGQIIDVPGTSTERRVVTFIVSDTELVVNSAFVNTATGQTATRVNTGLVAIEEGRYLIVTHVAWASGVTGYRRVSIVVNGSTTIAQQISQGVTVSSITTDQVVSSVYDLSQWDYVETHVIQDTSASLNVTASSAYSPEFSMYRII